MDEVAAELRDEMIRELKEREELKHRKLKKQLEEFTASAIADVVYPGAIRKRRGDPNRKEPDFLYEHNGKTIGIEATTASYSGDLLRREFQLAVYLARPSPRGVIKPDPKFYKDPPADLLLRAIEERVDDKLGKLYQGYDELTICIYVHALIISEDEMRDILHKVTARKPKVPGSACLRIAQPMIPQKEGNT